MAALWTLSPLLFACLLWPACLALTPGAEPLQPQNLPSSLGLNSSDGSPSVDLPMALRVFSVDYHHVQAPFEIVLWIMLASLAKLGFHWSGRVPAVVPESCLLIMVGLLVGGVIYGVRHSAPPTLSADAFFLFLLPPIVLDAGYFLPGRMFFENLGTILWLLWNIQALFCKLQTCSNVFLTSVYKQRTEPNGIVTCAVTMKQYVEANVSERSNTSIQYFLKMWSSVSETLIFIFLGVSTIQDVHMWSWPFVCSTLLLCLVWRASGVLLLTAVVNKLRRNTVTFRDQFIIAYGGMRGAICFSLVFLIDDFPKKRLFITTTIVVILFTVFVQGMTIKPLVELLDVKRKKRGLNTVSEEIHSRLIDHLLAGIEDVVGYWGQHYWKDKFEQFNKKYLRRFLIRDDHQAHSSILRVYQELERREQRGDEEAPPPVVDHRSHTRPLLPEEMESIRRILSRNLQHFNNMQRPAYSRHTLHQDATMGRARKPLHRHQSLGERCTYNTQGEDGEFNGSCRGRAGLSRSHTVCSMSPRPVLQDASVPAASAQTRGRVDPDSEAFREEQISPEQHEAPAERAARKQLSFVLESEKQP
ncbi:sodium/hydrogen exchanger 2-like [Notothenia coriiceps]|uniref:Sodium/hydrogen exchanger n=1 Tax=Notothenia coriiceps TaxID=8208 RepID=A0A6I9N113_9TELE|nr:PREDICTED: sodium/hydrogen exchanger 2-like [Notothenia coriiceps]